MGKHSVSQKLRLTAIQTGKYDLLFWIRQNWDELVEARNKWRLTAYQLAMVANDAGIKNTQGGPVTSAVFHKFWTIVADEKGVERKSKWK